MTFILSDFVPLNDYKYMKFLEFSELSQKVSNWCDQLEVVLDSELILNNPVLLVLDMQNEFLEEDGQLPVWGGQAVIPNILKLITLFRKENLPIIYTQHFCLEPYEHKDSLAVMRYISNPQTFLQENSQGAAIYKDLLPQQNEQIIKKYRYSAFYNTQLETLLRIKKVTDVIITGVATNICCETTAHDAFFRGFNVYFPVDATGGTDETSHFASIKNIYFSYGTIVKTEQIQKSLNH